ncbi:MAG: response regulator [Leptolyngbyaceae cyanobacterium RU_5_1]|nr:response regulator [Leptolyngbyaceae cyanobacterium RU_5_1]
MTLRQRTLVIIGVTLVALNTALYAIASSLLLKNSQRAERQDMQQQMNGVLNLLAQSVEQFNVNFTDWAIWDDAYAFVQDGNPQFIRSNLIDAQLAYMQINLIAFIQPSGRIVFGTGFDLKNNRRTPIPVGLQRHLVSSAKPTASQNDNGSASVDRSTGNKDILLQHTNSKSAVAGVLSLPEGAMMLISRPVLTSQGKGPIRGTLIVGRYLDDGEVNRLAKITRLPLLVQPVQQAQLPPSLQSWQNFTSSEQPAIAVQPLNETTIAGYALLNDIYGQPAIVIRTESQRIIYQQGQAMVRFLTWAILGIGVVFCIVALLLLERLALSRLTKLSTEVSAIRRDNLSSRVSVQGRDELSDLAVRINTMLADLEEYEQNRQQAAIALQQSEAKFRNIFENSQVGIFRTRLADGLLLDANQRIVTMFGYDSVTEAVGLLRSIDFYVNLSDRQRALEILQTHGEIHNFEVQLRRRDGSTFWGLYSARCNVTAGYAEGVVADISDRKRIEAERRQTEEALHQSEATNLALIHAIPDLLLRIRNDGTYLDVVHNAQYRLFDPNQRATGTTVYDSLPPDKAQTRMDYIQRALETGELQVYEQQLVIKAEPRDEEVRLMAIRDNEVLVMVRDITERKRNEVALRQAVEAAEAANRAKSVFLANMSHELRTPLNVILGFTQLLARDHSLNPQQQDYLDTINRSGEHLLTLINDVLEMSKIEAGRTTLSETDFDLHDLLDWLYQMFQFKAQSKGLQFTIERDSNLPEYIHTDESKLRQVLVNLVGNAVKFTAQGHVVLRVGMGNKEDTETRGHGDAENQEDIRTRGREDTGNEAEELTASPRLPLSASNSPPPSSLPPSSLFFEVEDTGPGIAPTDLKQLFQPFVQTETGQKSHEGTGLGLAISQKFVQLMGGEITVSSVLGSGSTFRFTVQVQAVEPGVRNDLVVSRQVVSRQIVGLEVGQPAYRILIVEDKLENRRILLELLAPVGFEVQEATHGEDAIALWERWFPDLIWMDIRMPVMNGYEATKQIKAASRTANREPPIIIALTGSAFEEDRRTALSMGCDDFVRKPVRAEVIFEKMADHLGVRYRYAEELGGRGVRRERSVERDMKTQRLGDPNAPSSPHPPISPSPLTPSDLAVMSIAWIEQLHQAAIKVNARLVLNLIEQIPESSSNLANALRHWVDDFCFEEIVELTQACLATDETAKRRT